jgi:hypothetical protein
MRTVLMIIISTIIMSARTALIMVARHNDLLVCRQNHRGKRSARKGGVLAPVTVDRNVALVAEDWQGDLRQRLALPIEADLAANLQGPAGISILLRRLVRLIRPDLIGTLAGLDGVLLGVRITLDPTARLLVRLARDVLEASPSYSRRGFFWLADV